MQLGRRLWSLLVVLVVLRRVFWLVCECFYFLLFTLCGVWAAARPYFHALSVLFGLFRGVRRSLVLTMGSLWSVRPSGRFAL